MKLMIDLGNTRLKWGLVSGVAHVERSGELEYHTLNDLGTVITGGSTIASIAMTSVASDVMREQVREQLARSWPNVPIHVVKNQARMCGVMLSYQEPARLGVDRALAMVAAWRIDASPCLVLDGGSALTADYIDSRGRHLGGYIAPGLAMLKRTLLSDTAHIYVGDHADVSLTPGSNTEQCVTGGVRQMYAGALERFVEQARRLGVQRVLVTGGDRDLIAATVPGVQVLPHLVIQGLAHYIEEGGAAC